MSEKSLLVIFLIEQSNQIDVVRFFSLIIYVSIIWLQ